MPAIQKNYDLTLLNTFKLQSRCDFFLEINQESDLDLLLAPQNIPSLSEGIDLKNIEKKILGGGSNLILSQHISGLVLKNNLQGISMSGRFVHVASGENWNHFVHWCLKNKFYGLENLALIPGTVGAAPIQNIGAYGVEVKKFLHSVQGVHLQNGVRRKLSNKDCEFKYRHSIFKTPAFADFFITQVVFFFPESSELEYSYGELKEHFSKILPTAESIASKVTEIRTRKLPDLIQFPNVGSYFKNPIISQEQADSLREKFPDLVTYPYENHQIKLSAGQLIEKCGFKGKVHGTCSMYEKQALVMVNLGKSHFQDVLTLEKTIISSVYSTFQVSLESEPIKW